jgi:Methyltransferase domain
MTAGGTAGKTIRNHIAGVRTVLRSLLPQPVRVCAHEISSLGFPAPGTLGEVSFFHANTIRPEILHRWRPTVLEIGVLHGGHSRLLLNACSQRLGRLISIDPAPSGRIAMVLDLHPLARLIREPSLEALSTLAGSGLAIDVAVVDGDHNYYTVLRELFLVEKLLLPAGVVFIHDVAWPYGRRDGYYQVDRIPPEDRHPSARLGIIQGRSALVESGGFNSTLENALYEGGPRNGVLTAVQDFMSQSAHSWTLEVRTENHGLGILRRAPSSERANS